MPRVKKAKKEDVKNIFEDILTDDKPIEHKDTDLIDVEIKKAFMDKYKDGIIYEVGQIRTFTYKRVKEIMKKDKSFIEIIEK